MTNVSVKKQYAHIYDGERRPQACDPALDVPQHVVLLSAAFERPTRGAGMAKLLGGKKPAIERPGFVRSASYNCAPGLMYAGARSRAQARCLSLPRIAHRSVSTED